MLPIDLQRGALLQLPGFVAVAAYRAGKASFPPSAATLTDLDSAVQSILFLMLFPFLGEGICVALLAGLPLSFL